MPSTKKSSAAKKTRSLKAKKPPVRLSDMRPERNPVGGVPINGVPINGLDEPLRTRTKTN